MHGRLRCANPPYVERWCIRRQRPRAATGPRYASRSVCNGGCRNTLRNPNQPPAIEFLFIFTLASGLLVLYAALMGSQDERTRESGLLRALGATRKQLSQAQLIEFSLVGALSGVLAATGAAAMGWALATYQFKFAWAFSPSVWLVGLVAGAVCAIAGGWLGLRNVLRQPPLQTLREA